MISSRNATPLRQPIFNMLSLSCSFRKVAGVGVDLAFHFSAPERIVGVLALFSVVWSAYVVGTSEPRLFHYVERSVFVQKHEVGPVGTTGEVLPPEGVGWGPPGSSADWPPLWQLGRNLYAFGDEVIQAGNRDYVYELLRLDY